MGQQSKKEGYPSWEKKEETGVQNYKIKQYVSCVEIENA